MSERAIPPRLEPEILAKSGDGWSAQRISEWLLTEQKVSASRPAVQRFLAKVAKDRAPIAQAITREKLASTITKDLDAVDGILDRARKDENAASRLEDVEQEVERIAKVDIAKAYGPLGTLLPLDKMDEDVRRAIAGIEVVEQFENVGDQRVKTGELVKVKFWDKPRTLEMLGKMRASLARREMALKARDQQLRALTLRLELSGAGGGSNDDAVEIRSRLLEKLKAAAGNG
jgi:hypothetical protein